MTEWTPHNYWPDYQAMGDCYVCGNTRQHCEAFQAEHEAKQTQAPADTVSEPQDVSK